MYPLFLAAAAVLVTPLDCPLEDRKLRAAHIGTYAARPQAEHSLSMAYRGNPPKEKRKS